MNRGLGEAVNESRKAERLMREEGDWRRVERALKSKAWDFRSAEGIAVELSLPPERVRALLEQHSDKVRTSLSRDWRVVYALKAKPVTAREVIDSLVTLASR